MRAFLSTALRCAAGTLRPKAVDLEWFADRGKLAGLASVVMIDTECLKQKTGDPTGRSTALACKFLRECLLVL